MLIYIYIYIYIDIHRQTVPLYHNSSHRVTDVSHNHNEPYQ